MAEQSSNENLFPSPTGADVFKELASDSYRLPPLAGAILETKYNKGFSKQLADMPREKLTTAREWGRCFLYTYKRALFHKETENIILKKLDCLWKITPGRFRLDCLNHTFTEQYHGLYPKTTALREWEETENVLLKSINEHQPSIIEWCLDHAANPNVRGEKGNTAFFRFLKEFPRPESDDIQEKSPYRYAAKMPTSLLIKFLRDADIMAVNDNGDTSIMAAGCNIPVIKRLIARGVNVGAVNKFGLNALDELRHVVLISKSGIGGPLSVEHPLEKKTAEFLKKMGLTPRQKVVDRQRNIPTTKTNQHQNG